MVGAVFCTTVGSYLDLLPVHFILPSNVRIFCILFIYDIIINVKFRKTWMIQQSLIISGGRLCGDNLKIPVILKDNDID